MAARADLMKEQTARNQQAGTICLVACSGWSRAVCKLELPGMKLAPAVGQWVRGLRFPKLAILAVVLLLADVVVLDAVPFVDEIVLAAVAAGLSSWRKKRADRAQVQVQG